MFRAYILLGFTILIAQLHISGNITKYINMKYAYLSTTAAIILGFLTIIQINIVFRNKLFLPFFHYTTVSFFPVINAR
ncbi:DUF1980 domain-containing protein, partial [Bacillus sp. SS-TM]